MAGALVAASAASAAAAKKPTMKVKSGSYTVTAPPDPTMQGTGEPGMECFNIDPASADNHPLTLPGTGMLKIVLDSPDPTKNHVDGVAIRSCTLAGEPTATVTWTFTYR